MGDNRRTRQLTAVKGAITQGLVEGRRVLVSGAPKRRIRTRVLLFREIYCALLKVKYVSFVIVYTAIGAVNKLLRAIYLSSSVNCVYTFALSTG